MSIVPVLLVTLSLLLAAAKVVVGYDISWFWIFMPVTAPLVFAFGFFIVVAISAYKKEDAKREPLYPWNR